MFKLPPLPYSFDALEPYIDAKTMEVHYTKHYQGYLNNLNTALEKYPAYGNMSIEDLLQTIDTLPADLKVPVRNQGGGYYNHMLFWPMLKKNTADAVPLGAIGQAINQYFSSFDVFKQEFEKLAKGLFGSGWVWLSLAKDKKLTIAAHANQDNPLMQGNIPLLGIDVWEHAYYLKYQNKRADYIDAWWRIINWEYVEELYQKALK